jgi:hypothetical protein
MDFMTRGRTSTSRWYDGHCLSDKLKIYALRIVIVVGSYLFFSWMHVPAEYNGEVQEEPTCSRVGWGGDC